jgi:hypothetical protein
MSVNRNAAPKLCKGHWMNREMRYSSLIGAQRDRLHRKLQEQQLEATRVSGSERPGLASSANSYGEKPVQEGA